MKKNTKYSYTPGQRFEVHGSRQYDFGDGKLPSVTSILSRTKDQAFLDKWKARVGEQEAERIKNVSSKRGTSMHKFLENYISNIGYDDLSSVGNEARPMAQKIIDLGLINITEYYGSEVSLYYPDLYAGATDVVGIYNGRESIIDFKQTNKPKRREWIDDYFIQLGAYAMAHNYVYQTKIQSGIILMCSKDKLFQKFEVTDKEFVGYQHAFLKKVDQYYRNCNQNPDEKDTKNKQISEEISH